MNKEIVRKLFPEAVKKVYLDNFRDALSLSEFRISGMCQKCQDKVFK